MAADENNDTMLNSEFAEADDESLDKIPDLDDDGLESQLASEVADGEDSIDGDDLEAQMTATIALESDTGEFDLEAQMEAAMDEEGFSDIGDSLDMEELEDEHDSSVKSLEFPVAKKLPQFFKGIC